jgi:hypothetical protein
VTEYLSLSDVLRSRNANLDRRREEKSLTEMKKIIVNSKKTDENAVSVLRLEIVTIVNPFKYVGLRKGVWHTLQKQPLSGVRKATTEKSD